MPFRVTVQGHLRQLVVAAWEEGRALSRVRASEASEARRRCIVTGVGLRMRGDRELRESENAISTGAQSQRVDAPSLRGV